MDYSTEITDKILEKEGIICIARGCYEDIQIGSYRYCLEIEITSCKTKPAKTLACIMMNPSTTFPDEEWTKPDWKQRLGKRMTKGFDPTVRNVIRLANSVNYSRVIVYNTFPYIQPDSEKAFSFINEEKEKNLEFIWSIPCKEILIAWGIKTPKDKKVKDDYLKLQSKYLEFFKKSNITPVAYAWNNNEERPYHPSLQVNNTLTEVNGEIRGKKKGEEGLIAQFINYKKEFIPLKIENGRLYK